MNLPSYDILQVKFVTPMSGIGILNVKNDFLRIPIDAIDLAFSCNYHVNDNQWIKYVMTPNGIEPKRSGICQGASSETELMITSTKTALDDLVTISSKRTINTKSYFSFIPLLRKSYPLLFYLLISYFILMICAIAISLYIFSRYGCRIKRQLIDGNSTTRSSVTSVDTSNTTAMSEKSADSSPLKSKGVASPSNEQANLAKHNADRNKRVVDKRQDF